MARTLLTYSVQTSDEWNEKKQAIVRKVKHRGFDFSVSGVKTEQEEFAYLDSFVNYLFEQTGIDSRGNYFGDDTRKVLNEDGAETSSTFVSISVFDAEQKDAVRSCYNEWKCQIKPFLFIVKPNC